MHTQATDIQRTRCTLRVDERTAAGSSEVQLISACAPESIKPELKVMSTAEDMVAVRNENIMTTDELASIPPASYYLEAVRFTAQIQGDNVDPQVVESLVSEAEALIIAGKWLDLAQKMLASFNLISCKASVEDHLRIFTTICNIVRMTGLADELQMVMLIMDEVHKSCYGPALEVPVLNTLFDLLISRENQYTVFQRLTFLAVCGKVDECTVQFYNKTDGILENLKVGVEARRLLYICISDALKEYKSSPQDSFNFLIKYLATISDGDVIAMEKAKLNAVRAVFEVIRIPGHFECTFHKYPAVVQLMEDDKYKMIYELLKIFRTQEYEAYMAFYIENSLRLNELGIPHEECVEKMRLITLMEMCDADLEYSFENEVCEIENGRKNEDDVRKEDGYEVSYAQIQETLKISADDVKSWVDKAVNFNLLDCTFDDTNRKISVSRCNERVSDLNEWPSIRLKGIDWTKIHKNIGKRVVKQRGLRCWSIACAEVISHLFYIEHRRKAFAVASQELLERVIKAFPGIATSNDFGEDNATKTYGTAYPYGFQFCMDYGLGLESNYPTRTKRDVHKPFPPEIHEIPRVYIGGYQWLGDCIGKKHRNKVFKALYKQTLIGNINVTRRFQKYKSGIFKGTDEEVIARHSVVIVGVNIVENYFIILNSWGRSWGKNGFARVSCELIDGISRPFTSSIVEEVPQKPRSESLKVKHEGECKATQSAELLKDPTLLGIEDKPATWSILPKENAENIQVVEYECGRNCDNLGGETGFCKAEESSLCKSSFLQSTSKVQFRIHIVSTYVAQ